MGQPTAQPVPAPPGGTVYGRGAPQGGPHRPQGTVYGGGTPVGFQQSGAGFRPSSPMETSGSLTGHILSQGRPDAPEAPVQKGSTGRVVVILAVALGTLVIIGMIIAIFFHDALSHLFKSLFSA
jgi:hypothetical protein